MGSEGIPELHKPTFDSERKRKRYQLGHAPDYETIFKFQTERVEKQIIWFYQVG